MKINVQGVLISFDELIEGSVPITYSGRAEKIEEIKEIVASTGGKYGNRFNPEFCLAIDLVIALQKRFKVKIDPDVEFYDPPIPDGAIP